MSQPTPREGMQSLVQVLSPGGRLVAIRRLRGGLGARMHVIRIESEAGDRRSLVLRRYVAGWRDSDGAKAENEFRVLKLVESAGVPAPRPILLDAESRFFEAPCMVLSYLSGRSFHVPRRPQVWASEMAVALASVHGVTSARFDLSWLKTHARDEVAEAIEDGRRRAADAEPLALEIVVELERRLANVALDGVCLIHADFHPGNTVFNGARLSGIVDWSDARLGDPRFDVAQCRLDIVLSHGTGLADYFEEAYEAALGQRIEDLAFFDLERGLPALFHYKRWLDGYHDAGLTHLTEAAAGERLHNFLQRALAQSRLA